MSFQNITPELTAILERGGIEEGPLLGNAMHTTATVFINDDEPGLHHDYRLWLEQFAPFDVSPERQALRTSKNLLSTSDDSVGAPQIMLSHCPKNLKHLTHQCAALWLAQSRTTTTLSR